MKLKKMYNQDVDFCDVERCIEQQTIDRSLGYNYPSHRIMLFDLSIHGHHPAYIQHLISYWHIQNLPGHLDIVVSPQFFQHHAEVVNLVAQKEIKNVSFVAIDSDIEAALKPRKSGWSRMQRTFQEWHVLCDYARKLKATHCLIMYFDTCQLPLALGEKPPCPVSGIYFKPTFHYSQFGQSVSSWNSRLQEWREKWLLARVLQHSHLKTLFCLDPFAVQSIDRLLTPGKTVALPDPVQVGSVSPEQVTQLREQLGIEAGRQIFLLFGCLNGRKGIYQLLDAIAMLPAELSKTMCLLLVGQANQQDQLRTLSLTSTLSLNSPVQIITHHEFVPESEVQTYFHLADVVLAPYQKHAGMSGILIWAAVAQKPVLSSNYGLMGELVRRYQLGLAIDSTHSAEIAQGLTQFLRVPPTAIGDRQLMQVFAEQNSAERFADVIFQYLCRYSK